MKILISGSSGFVGSRLFSFLTEKECQVTKLAREQTSLKHGTIFWNPDEKIIHSKSLEGFDAFIHLAGENIASQRWTKKQKIKIKESRIKGTKLLVETILKLKSPPNVFLCASATGYYGNRDEEVLNENSKSGNGFLANVCREWEETCIPLKKTGIRVINLRFGIILSASNGALANMLLPFKLGFGGVIGNGKQYMPWITIHDAVAAIHHLSTMNNLQGPVNIVSPNAVTNYEFTKALGKVLSRPTFIPFPASLIKLILGKMADELLLSSTRVLPEKLLTNGFKFSNPELEESLRIVIKEKYKERSDCE